MLAKKSEAGIVPKGDYSYELKWDGIRAIIVCDSFTIRIFSRSGRDITEQFPELCRTGPKVLKSGVYDAEICCHNEDDIPSFPLVTSRLHLGSGHTQAARTNPATAYLFDLLEVGGETLIGETYTTRRHRLGESMLDRSLYWEVSGIFEDGHGLLRRVREEGREGIMAKHNKSPYYPGKRRNSWIKVKVKFHEDVLIVGYTDGLGKRDGAFGALILEDLEGNPCGRVGTGFTDKELLRIFARLHDCGIRETSKGIHWLNRALSCEIEYMTNTGGARREPVFRGLKDD